MFSIKRDFLHLRVKKPIPPVSVLSGAEKGQTLVARAAPLPAARWQRSNVNSRPQFLSGRQLGRGRGRPEPKEGGALLFLGTVQFAFCFILAEIYYPGYDVSAN